MDQQEVKVEALVQTNFMKVFVLPEAIVLLTLEELASTPHGVRARIAYNNLDIKLTAEYQTEEEQCSVFNNFNYEAATKTLEEIKPKLETETKPSLETENEQSKEEG